MTWQDHDERGDEAGPRPLGGMAGDWQGIQPTLDNPLSWSLSLGRIAGITLRVHVLFLAYIIVSLMQSLGEMDIAQERATGFQWTALSLAALVVVVILHEIGHCVACRLTGGEADEVLLWPLGGLAHTRPPQRWSAHLLTALGGPFVNVVICAVLTLVLGLRTGQWWAVAIPNPLALHTGIKAVENSWTLIAIYEANAMSYVLLWFNLLPMFPLDGGRIVQACLWSRLGYVRSMRVAVRLGYLGSLVLAVLGAAQQQWMLVAVALFGAVTCYGTHRQLEFTQQALGREDEEEDYALAPQGERRAETGPPQPSRVELRRREQAAREALEAREVDRVLQKIAESGMGSLTGRERQVLKRETERKRREQKQRP